MFISNITELILGCSFAIFIFLIFYYVLLTDNEVFMKDNMLNVFLIIIFIILFFLIGYLIKNVFLIMKDIKEQKRETIVINKPNPFVDETK